MSETSRLIFANRLLAYMRQRGWSQNELARRAGLSKDAISTYSRGLVMPTHSSLAKLSDCLRVRIEDLMPGYAHLTGEEESSLKFEESARYPGMTYLYVRRTVPTATAFEIVKLLRAVEEKQSDYGS